MLRSLDSFDDVLRAKGGQSFANRLASQDISGGTSPRLVPLAAGELPELLLEIAKNKSAEYNCSFSIAVPCLWELFSEGRLPRSYESITRIKRGSSTPRLFRTSCAHSNDFLPANSLRSEPLRARLPWPRVWWTLRMRSLRSRATSTPGAATWPSHQMRRITGRTEFFHTTRAKDPSRKQ